MHEQVTVPDRVVVDVSVVGHGSIVMLYPQTPQAVEWIDKHIGPDNSYQPQYPTIICEPRYVDDVVEGMLGDGLAVDP
ncbi:hypothetical protein LCGC14_2662380 [marine sediment metagenome]|uniref:Uncharacterized protein n=1 Tax=marine sediment metagenome TaxID=412755 RepID=A0A0F9C1S1_9ZZZZ